MLGVCAQYVQSDQPLHTHASYIIYECYFTASLLSSGVKVMLKTPSYCFLTRYLFIGNSCGTLEIKSSEHLTETFIVYV